MRVCMVSPHLPPEQAANAILPVVLAHELAHAGVDVSFVAHPAGVRSPVGEVAPVVESIRPTGSAIASVPRRGQGWFARTPVGAAMAAGGIALGARRAVATADIVHLHSNGLIVEVAAALARRAGKPWVITLYGTDVWHHEPARHGRFGAVVRDAAHRVFYSQALLEFGRAGGLAQVPSSVIYAPVAPAFRPASDDERRALRERLEVDRGPLLLTVKRLHPVAGHEDLLRALPDILRTYPEVRLLLIGDGVLRAALETLARELGVAAHVRFLGALDNQILWQYLAAADLFVLPSRLESWGTVMLEALACGTPVVATDTAGAQEVRSYFSDDVTLCERENPRALAATVLVALRGLRRTSDAAAQVLRDRFSPAACATQYRAVYEDALRRKSS